MVNGGYDFDKANDALESKQADLVAFGVPYLANPDLLARMKKGAALNVPDQSTFYTGGAEGYIDYPTHEEAERAA